MEHRVLAAEWTEWDDVGVHDTVEENVTVSANEGTHKGNAP